MTKVVVYGVDIAVIKIGERGKPIGRRGFAWARLAPPESGVIDPSLFMGDQIGIDLNMLVSSIAEDLRAGADVALGFEAPMWTPAPSVLPDEGNLFDLRFKPQEVGYGWYMQSGAAATMKALTLGKILISQLVRLGFRPQFITERKPPSPGQLCLFEAFVTGTYRTPPAQSIFSRRMGCYYGSSGLCWSDSEDFDSGIRCG